MTKYLTVSELSRRSGIPRTTVQRWLKRFELFLISALATDNGVERAVYHERTVKFLQWVEKHRNDGITFEQIENMLTRNIVISESNARRDNNKLMDIVSKLQWEKSCLEREVEDLRRKNKKQTENYADLSRRVYTASLWQRILKSW